MLDENLAEFLVFPTHVGMNRRGGEGTHLLPRIPHTRGDEPSIEQGASSKERIPHTRGDEPQPNEHGEKVSQYSPHTWG